MIWSVLHTLPPLLNTSSQYYSVLQYYDIYGPVVVMVSMMCYGMLQYLWLTMAYYWSTVLCHLQPCGVYGVYGVCGVLWYLWLTMAYYHSMVFSGVC